MLGFEFLQEGGALVGREQFVLHAETIIILARGDFKGRSCGLKKGMDGTF